MGEAQQWFLTVGSLAGAITTIIALAKLVISPVRLQLTENKKDNQAIKNGLNVLLRRELQSECETAIENGHICSDQVSEITDIYEAYHALGGNGSGTAIYNKAMRIDSRRKDN